MFNKILRFLITYINRTSLYNFLMPCLPKEFIRTDDILISELKMEDVALAVEVSDSVLGKDYIESQVLVENIGSYDFICYKAQIDSKVVGVGIGCIFPEKMHGLI